MNLKQKGLCFAWTYLHYISVLIPLFCAIIVYAGRFKEDACQSASNRINEPDIQLQITSSIYETDDANINSCAAPSSQQLSDDVSIYSRCLSRKCKNGTFVLPGMDTCHHWLNCTNLANEVEIIHEIKGGAVKKLFLGVWQHNFVVVSKPIALNSVPIYKNDFESGLNFLVEHSPNDCLIQLVGFCLRPLTIVTEYHRTGSAVQFADVMESKAHQKSATLKTRFQLCLDYVEILAWLHSDFMGTRVMCDSNDLRKTLEQYLLLDDLRLVLNDVDALPKVNHMKKQFVKCGHRQLHGDFVAPEQRWPYPHLKFDDSLMPFYDEKTDVWKIPDVCQYFIYGSQDETVILYHLFGVHKQCKSVNPKDRPTTHQVLIKYRDVWKTLGFPH